MLYQSFNDLKKVDTKDLFYKICFSSKSLVFKRKLFNRHIKDVGEKKKDVGQLFHACFETSHFDGMQNSLTTSKLGDLIFMLFCCNCHGK